MTRMFPLVRAACASLIALLLLASCGGGTQVEKFVPTRLLVFGDETSVLLDANNDANARKFGINALKVDKVALDCALNPIWVQTLAASFGLTFQECNPKLVAAPTNRIYAASDASSVDVPGQIDRHLAGDSFFVKDLVTILAGAKDIITQYETVKAGVSEAAAAAELEAAGTALSAQVNRVARLGGKVLISLVPDMGLTPYAVAEEVGVAGRAAMLSRLTSAFNQKLRIGIINDGKLIGLLLTDELIQTIYKGASATSTSYINAKAAACDPAKAPQLQLCSTETLVTGATSSNYLWADDRHLSAGGHLNLGQIAVSRATNNPF